MAPDVMKRKTYEKMTKEITYLFQNIDRIRTHEVSAQYLLSGIIMQLKFE